jgi:hypothetical protein
MSVLSLRGPAWVVVRQHRRTLWAGLALLVLLGGILVYQRLHSAAAVADAVANSDCASLRTARDCDGTARFMSDAETAFHHWLGYLGLALFVIPGLVGAFVAGPVIARELESGTYKLAWTQSVSPARWLTAKLAVPAVWTIAGVSALAALYRWASTTGPDATYLDTWYEPGSYAGLGPAAVGYALLGIALGALAGLLARRTVVAMSVTVPALVAVQLAVGNQLRTHLWPVTTLTGRPRDLFGRGGWTTDSGMMTASGTRLHWQDCADASLGPDAPCMRDRGAVTYFADYHPAAHFWPLQLVETGVVLVLAGVVTFAAFRVLRRRHG